MSQLQQSSFRMLTLAEWMNQHRDQLDHVVFALCQIFDLPDPRRVALYLEEEIEQQARLFFIISDEQIIALAGWNWAHIPHQDTELPVYLGIRRNLDTVGLRMTLISSVMSRLREDRRRSGHTHVVTAWLQYHPGDHVLRDLCESLGYQRDQRRNDSFRDTLGAQGALRSLIAPIT